MKFDFNKLKEMNDLDFEQVAIWPFEVKVVVSLVVAIISGVLTFYLMINEKLPVLEKAQDREQELKQSYRSKYGLASNLEAYQQQLEQLQLDFAKLVESLPTSNETPGLLDDITLVGTTSGLTFKLLDWQKDIPKEFYTELPIRIEVEGRYHDFGEFLAKIASLPRIVTVHDFELYGEGQDLQFKMQAKTYRTSLQEELQ
ncbi:MAG: type 4a pilus biogenesis protein PilO [Aestuariibacter sp.]